MVIITVMISIIINVIRLRVLLHPVNLDTDPDAPNFNNDVVLATLIDDTLDHWKEAQVLYTYPEEHTVSNTMSGQHQENENNNFDTSQFHA